MSGDGCALGGRLAKAQTVGEWLDEWLAGKRKARNTIRSYYGHIRLHLKPHLGDIPLDRLRRIHIQTAYDQILAANATRQRPVSPATVQRIHATLRASLNDAVAEGRMADNPAVHVELPSGQRPKAVVWTKAGHCQWLQTGDRPKVAVWTPVQTGDFLDYAMSDRLYAYYHLLVFRGPRRGEGRPALAKCGPGRGHDGREPSRLSRWGTRLRSVPPRPTVTAWWRSTQRRWRC